MQKLIQEGMSKRKAPTEIVNENVFVNSAEIMQIFHITRITFNKWKRTSSFPEAICLAKRPMWMTEEIIHWAKDHRSDNPLCNEILE